MPRPLLAVALLAACTEPPTSVESQEAQVYCDEFLCTGNGTTVIGKDFGELHEGGAISPAGFSIVQSYAPDGTPVTLDVTGVWPKLIFPAWDGRPPLSGSQMVNGWIRVSTPFLDEHAQLDIRIKEYLQLPYFDGYTGPRMAGFRLEYMHNDPEVGTYVAKNVCPHEEIDAQGIAGTWAIMSQGDRFSNDGSIIASGNGIGGVGGWFNISCSGSVIAKLLKIHHAVAAHDGTHSTKLDQRKAALRMFTARYCEDGPMYTVNNTPLTWEDFAPWTKRTRSAPEAIWTAKGAYCLVKPRYADPDDIACDIPTCTAAELEKWRSHGWLISANPY